MQTAIEKKFINMVSPSLDKFKWRKDNLATCRCFKCGDSQKNKTKTRGYFYINQDHYYYKCHNCGFSCTIKTVLDNLSPQLAKEYALESYKNRIIGIELSDKIQDTPKQIVPDYIGVQVSKLQQGHMAKKYLEQRGIPVAKYEYLYYCDDFSKIAERFLKNSIKEPRLVIPFFDENEKVVGVQGRSFEKNPKIRYITYKSPHIERLWYGMERINPLNDVYVVEGPLDSLFLSNCIAMVGSSYPETLPNKIKDSNIIFAFDNEPRNFSLHAMMKKSIDDGHKIVIWPSIEEKDINDMVNIFGISKVRELIDSNTYSGNAARLKFNLWRKV